MSGSVPLPAELWLSPVPASSGACRLRRRPARSVEDSIGRLVQDGWQRPSVGKEAGRNYSPELRPSSV